MRVRRASMSIGLGLSLMAGVLTSVVISATPAQAIGDLLPTIASAQPIGFNGRVSGAAGTADTLFLGGDFTQAGRTTGAGAFAETQVPTGPSSVVAGAPQFAKGTAEASVYASAYYDNYGADGTFGWFVGGDFSSVGGHARSNFAEISFTDPGGQGQVVDWAPAFNGTVSALAVKPASGNQGAILYVGGAFTSVTLGGTTSARTRLAAFDITAGTLLPWAPSADADVLALTIAGNQVYVGGAFTGVTPFGGTPTPRARVAAFTADDTGTLLPWAPTVGNFNVFSLATQDDTVYLGGDFQTITPVGGSATPRLRVAAVAMDDTGTLLPWAPSFNNSVSTLSVTESVSFAGGRPALIVGGNFTGVTAVGASQTSRTRIAAVGMDDTGTLLAWAPSFNGNVLATSVSRQLHRCPDGRTKCVYVGGSFSQAGSTVGGVTQSRVGIAAVSLDDTGTLTTWSPGVSGLSPSAASSVATVSAAPANDNVSGRAFFGGFFTLAGMTARTRLAALDSQGELTSWAPSVGGGVSGGVGGTVRALTAGGGQVYVGGTFTTASGNDGQSASRRCAASFDTSGVMSAWDPISSGTCVQLNALAYSGGRVYVGGNFYTPSFTAVNLTAFEGTGAGALTGWIPRAGQEISSMALAQGRIYVAGPTLTSFTQNGQSVTRRGVASILLDDSGTLTSWNPNVTGGAVNAVSVAGSRAFIGGAFTTVGGQSRARLAAVSTDDTGSLLPLNLLPSSTVRGVAYAGDRLIIGGNFTSVSSQTREYFATIDDSGSGILNAAMNAFLNIEMVTSIDGQVILGGDGVASLGGVSIGSIAYGPRAPSSVTASAYESGIPLDGELSLSWTAPWSGTFPLQGYRIEMSSDGGSTWSTLVANTGNLNTIRTITGLTNGTPYSFKITALTVLGSNTSEASTPVAPVGQTGVIRGSQTQLANPAGLLRDSSGRLYAANSNSGGPFTVTVYAPGAVGNVAPVARLVRTAGITGAPVGLSWGADGSVWVSYTSCFLARFPALAPGASGDISADWVIDARSLGSGSCKGMAVSPVGGELSFVRGTHNVNRIVTIASSAGGSNGSPSAWDDNVSALRTVNGLTFSYLLSADSSGDLVVGDETASVTIPRLANGTLGVSVTPLQRVTNMYWAKQGVERSDGSLVVTEESGVGQPVLNVFAPEASGAATPIAVVNGSATLSTTSLQGVALSADELTAYVTSSSNAITWISGLPALESPPSPPTPTPTPTPNPGDPPSAPREVSAVAGDASATVAWAAPSSPGSFPVSSYQVTASPGGRGCMTTALTCTLGNLVNGTAYTFTVKALNGAGWSATSAPSEPVTPRATPQPTITIMITGTRSARTVEIAGSTRGIEPGSLVTPWIRKPGEAQAQAGLPQRVGEDGGFTWSRRVRSDGTLRAYVTWGDVRSNVVRLPAGRS